MHIQILSVNWKTVVVSSIVALFFATIQTIHASGVVNTATDAALRAALVGGGTVTFAVDGTIVLNSELTITNNTIVDGSGHNVSISGNNAVRVFYVNTGVGLTLSNLTIQNGRPNQNGGGIMNQGTLKAYGCTFSGNSANSIGGAIYSSGGAILNSCTFLANSASFLGGAIGRNDAISQQPVLLTNCTFVGNICARGAAIKPFALVSSGASNWWAVNSTFFGNVGTAIEGDNELTRPIILKNCIVANSTSANIVPSVIDGGNNIISDASGIFTNAFSLTNTDPKLGPLTNNGGTTLTMGLLRGSPAIDRGDDFTAPSTDQRGFPRPVGAASDVGAFEGILGPTNSIVRFITTDYGYGEWQGNALISIQREGPNDGTATVSFTATAGTAVPGVDFIPTNILVSFAEGEVQQVAYVSIKDDNVVDGAKTVLLTLHDSIGVALSEPTNSVLTIYDSNQPQGLPTSCDEAGLRAAINMAAHVVVVSDGTIVLTNTLLINSDTIVDGSGRNVIISGNNTTRVFTVTSPVTLSLINLTVANGAVVGTNGNPNLPGGTGQGGGVFVDGGNLIALDCAFISNRATGGKGGTYVSMFPYVSGGEGGTAHGGAIYLINGGLFATNCQFSGNTVSGGAGGDITFFLGQYPGNGGQSFGGALYAAAGTVALVECQFETNQCLGGLAGSVGASGSPASGGAFGGAICQSGGDLTVINGHFFQNTAFTPNPLIFQNSGSGSPTKGGALFNDGGLLILTGSEFISNNVAGGDAKRHLGTAGDGQGGAVFNGGDLTAINCTFLDNVALAGMQGSVGRDGQGGALYNAGPARVFSSSFTGNRAIAGSSYHGGVYLGPDGFGKGGAVYNAGNFVAHDNTFDGNLSEGAQGGGSTGGSYPGSAAFGGAIFNTGLCSVTNSTLTGNQVLGGSHTSTNSPPQPYLAGGNGLGGGVCNIGGTVQIVHATFSGNSARGGLGSPNGQSLGGGIQNSNGTVTLMGSIVANSSSGANAFGPLVDGGHNISSDASCSFFALGSLNNTDPGLGPLDDYGGPTPTMALLTGSPAIDGGDSAAFPPTDQRGHARPYGTTSDIGAFESSPPYIIAGQVSGFALNKEMSVGIGAFNTTTINSHYSITGLPAATYSVFPSDPGFVFYPSNRVVTVGPDLIGVDFNAYRWNMMSLEGVSNNSIQLIFAGTNGRTIQLLASSNLVGWFPVSTNTIGSSNLLGISITVLPTVPKLFFRTASD